MKEPTWPNVQYPPINYQDIIYYSAPKKQGDGPKSLDEVDPEAAGDLREAGHPAARTRTAGRRGGGRGVRQRVGRHHVQGNSSPRRASSSARSARRCRNHPDLVKKYLGSVVPYTDNFYAALNSAVFTDGSFCLHPQRACAVRWSSPPISASTPPIPASSSARSSWRTKALRELPRRLHRADAR